MGNEPLRGSVRAPAFPPDLAWLNVTRPLSLGDLRGRLVILDFWTSCCINCQHMIPELRRLEETYPDDVVVVGVHSPKFTAEKNIENVRAAVRSFDVTHPVVSDPDHSLWDAYAVHAWPTLVFIDPEGRVLGGHPGELRFPTLGEVVGSMLQRLRAAGTLAPEGMLPLKPEPMPSSLLAFPGGIAVDDRAGRLVVSDTGHHQVAVADLDGHVRTRIGRGVPGYSNGDGDAAFDAPRGLALAGDVVYVADTENHAVRAIDLGTLSVSTIAGTGLQTERPHRGGPARESALSSPWDVALSEDGTTLFIAMAGFHAIWALDLASGMIGPFSGTGHEGIKDDRRLRAWHAQPSGVYVDARVLYVADSETSAIRSVDLAAPDGAVRTLVGTGLFDFGDRDGPESIAQMQHPLGLCVVHDAVYVADTYNDALRRIDIKSQTVQTMVPTPGAPLGAPSALDVAGENIYIADTNNHAVRVYDTTHDHLTTLTLTE